MRIDQFHKNFFLPLGGFRLLGFVPAFFWAVEFVVPTSLFDWPKKSLFLKSLVFVEPFPFFAWRGFEAKNFVVPPLCFGWAEVFRDRL